MLTSRLSYLEILESLPRNAAVRSGLENASLKNEHSLPLTEKAFHKLGYQTQDLNRLNAIHITGSKGKGSTCHYVERILRDQGFKTGLFTSPHLLSPKERILINGQELDDEEFGNHIAYAYDRLMSAEDPIPFFRFITVTALYIFLKHAVDVAVIEVGIGGRFDCTNILPCPVVCGVTTLSLEHTNLLGPTLHDIAWHKCGIFKRGSFACVIDQAPNNEINTYAQSVAIESGTFFELTYVKGQLSTGTTGTYQALNGSLAISISRRWLERRLPSVAIDESKMISSLSQTRILGRQHIVSVGQNSLYLDVAHTQESLDDTLKWFKSRETANSERCTLFFYCSSPRSPEVLLTPFIKSGIFSKIYWPILPHSNEPLNAVIEICREEKVEFALISSQNLSRIFKSEVDAGSVILGCGSFYLVGELYRLITSSFQY